MIKLLSVIGHGISLIPHFVNHYSKYVDEIQLIVYQSPTHPELIKYVKESIKGYKNVKIVKEIQDRSFDWEKVTSLYNFIKAKSPHDWWVIADIDEFHLYPDDNLKKLIKTCEDNGWDIVRGGFIDRIGQDGEFLEIRNDISIFKQFSNMGFFRYPLSHACPNKVCLVKGYVEITNGQHYAKINGQTTWRWQGWNHPLINPNSFIQVHHFKWDITALERIKDVSSINQEYAYSEEYKKMYKELTKTRYKINLNNPDFMFESNGIKGEYKEYKQWDKLIKKITSI